MDINKLFLELPKVMQDQALKTNAAFREMVKHQEQIRDLSELLEISTAKWKREDRLWKDMLKDYPKPEEAESEVQN